MIKSPAVQHHLELEKEISHTGLNQTVTLFLARNTCTHKAHVQAVMVGKSIHQIPLFRSFLLHIFLQMPNAGSQFVQVE